MEELVVRNRKKAQARMTFVIALVLFMTFLNPSTSNAESKWNPISSQDYIFGFTSYKFSCWSGSFTNENAPILQVYDNGRWVDAAKGQILPPGSDLSAPCETAYPIAVGYQWTVMNPSPPIGLTGSARYSILYRQKLPDVVTKIPVQVTKSVPEVVTKTREVKTIVPEDVLKTRVVPKIKKTPYIATITKNGKKTKVIKYKSVIEYVTETYTETVWVDKVETQTYTETVFAQKTVTEYQDKITPGYTSGNGNVVVYPSEAAMRQVGFDLANGLACAFGFSASCKKP
jgi:hypothetical protein